MLTTSLPFKVSRRLVALGLVAALASVAPTASAQTIEPLDTSALDVELDKYWKAQDRLPTRNLQFTKEDRHEFSLFFGVLPNDSFFSYIPLGARWNFFFNKLLGVEVGGSYWLSLDGDLKSFLEAENLYAILTEKPQQLQWHASAALLFTPFHGKLAVFTNKLFHFDFQVALGVGALGTTVEDSAGESASKVDVAGHLGLGLRFYATRTIAVRADYKQFLFGGTSGVVAPAEFTLGVSFWTD